MKLLVDSCVSKGAVDELSAAGHDAIWVGAGPQDPGDQEILASAYSQGRVLLTLDKDFRELAVGRRSPHSGIIRLVGFRAVDQGAATLAVLSRYAAELISGALITVEPGRARIRPKEDDWT